MASNDTGGERSSPPPAETPPVLEDRTARCDETESSSPSGTSAASPSLLSPRPVAHAPAPVPPHVPAVPVVGGAVGGPSLAPLPPVVPFEPTPAHAPSPGSVPPSMSSSMSSSMTASWGSVTPEGMDCFGNERQTLAQQGRFYNSAQLSDLRLRVGERIYHAHKIILIRSSDVFERMLTSNWDDSSKQEVELREEKECVRVFPHFLKYLYSCHVVLNADNTLALLILADKYNVIDLRYVCIQFSRLYIIPKLQLKEVFHVWFQYATRCHHPNLISACVISLSERMEDITYSSEWELDWVGLDKDQLLEFLKSSDLIIKDEYELWLAVLKWLQAPKYSHRMLNVEILLRDILPCMRFAMMTPDQLCDLEKSKLVEQHPGMFQSHLSIAYKHHALSLASRASRREFTSSAYLLRNYTDLRWDKRLVIPNLSSYHRCSEVSLRFSTRASSFPPQTWEWDLKVYPKGFSSTSEDFRCILYSNLILDQPRPVEFSLSVADEKKVLATVTGRKNFCKNRYTVDSEIDKKVTVADLSMEDSPYVVNDHLILLITLRPVE